MDTPKSLYPMIITADLAATKAFYVDQLGWAVVFDLPFYLQVRFGDEPDAPELAFMAADAEAPVGVPFSAHEGRGLFLSLKVPDADAHHAALVERGVTPASQPQNKPWNWRAFIVDAPDGVHLDFFQPLPDAAATDATS